MSLSKVDFPAPLRPTRPMRSPGLIWKLTSSKMARPPKKRDALLTAKIIVTKVSNDYATTPNFTLHFRINPNVKRNQTLRHYPIQVSALYGRCYLPQ